VRILRRDALAALIIALIAGIAVSLPTFDVLRGFSIDLLTALRWYGLGQTGAQSDSPVVVVALDEESYRTPPFEGTPTVAWTREIGRVLAAIIDGGAKVVGFDIVFTNSIEQSQLPFGDDTLGARLRGFDRDFLRALNLAARDGKLVLGEVQHRDRPILPFPGQRAAIGQQRNIRALNVYSDRDGVVRRIPLSFVVDGGQTPSMAVELAARALGSPATFGPDGSVTLAGEQFGGLVPNTLSLNFVGGAGDVPTFSFADLAACAAKGDQAFFKRWFDGKVVLVGTLLDIEDRKLTSKRFATASEHARAARCSGPQPPDAPLARSSSIAGVYIQATAVNNLLRRDALIEIGNFGTAAIAIAFALAIALATVALAPVTAVAVYAATTLAWTAVATVTFDRTLVLPLAQPVLAGLLALAAVVGYRFVVTDRDKRLLRKSFALYLAPSVIEKMLESNRPPALGGETRNITSLFSDVAGFSTLSENRTPSEMVALMNEYLSAMTEIIEAHGGFVDKYIGDAIAAVFGAPLDDKDHARNAVSAALQCRQRLLELNQTVFADKGCKFGHRIGLNSGEGLVGNIGSRRRFNYTVMGDMVNLASRLEGANKYFGTSIMASDATVALTGEAFVWRELDVIRVQGRGTPVKIFEPLARAGEASAEMLACAAAYAEGLQRWRSRDFAGAATCFARHAHSDPPTARFLARAEAYAAHPPAPTWEPVNVLEGK
jgi:class 3 adenylate cyclase